MRHFGILCLVFVSSLPAVAEGIVIEGGIPFAEPEGETLRLTLYLPADGGNEPRPAVLLVHGGGWRFGSRAGAAWYGQRLAENGYVAAAADYRLMPKYTFPSCLHDVKAAVRWLRAHSAEHGIDPQRIGTLGDSAGGHLAALLATTRPEDGFEGDQNLGPSSAVEAAIILYGVLDMTYYRDLPRDRPLSGLGEDYFRRFVGESGPDGLDAYEAASPVTYVGADTAPVMLIHGEDDRLAPCDQARTFAERSRGAGVPTRLITLPDRGHAFDRFYLEDRERVFDEMLGFLAEHLGQDSTVEEEAALSR